jgi:transcriptional regulator with XRE-family HTH domain
MGRRATLEREHLAECFGTNLAKARRAADVSQDELACRSSTHRTAISQIERGLSLPGLDSALKFAAVLETSLDELLDGVAWKAPEAAVGKFEFADQTSKEPQRASSTS